MSEPNASGPPADDDAELEAGDELQFDQAEFATPAPAGPSCGFCKRPIDQAYHEINGKVICATCRQGVEAHFRGGSPVARVIKALVFGSVAAVVGAVLYYAIVRISGLNIGLVAVVVGFMVGGAVRKGTGNRGGLFYQLLAVFLTYSAIGLMDLSFEIEGHIKEQVAAPAKAAPPAEPTLPGLKFILVGLAILYALPVLYAFHYPISGLIYCFALWEAWKINKGVQLVFNGPFRVSTGASSAPAPEVFDDGR